MLGSPQRLLKQKHISVGSRHKKEKVIRHTFLAPAVCLPGQAPYFTRIMMSQDTSFGSPKDRLQVHLIIQRSFVLSVSISDTNSQTWRKPLSIYIYIYPCARYLHNSVITMICMKHRQLKEKRLIVHAICTKDPKMRT